jgi:hypothetical protein
MIHYYRKSFAWLPSPEFSFQLLVYFESFWCQGCTIYSYFILTFDSSSVLIPYIFCFANCILYPLSLLKQQMKCDLSFEYLLRQLASLLFLTLFLKIYLVLLLFSTSVHFSHCTVWRMHICFANFHSVNYVSIIIIIIILHNVNASHSRSHPHYRT